MLECCAIVIILVEVVMKISIKTKNYALGKRLQGLIEKKLAKLDKYFDTPAEATALCRVENKTHILELAIKAKGVDLRSEVRSDNMYDNLDIALPKLERQIIKLCQKKKSFERAVDMAVDEFMFLQETPTFEDRRITKTKQFAKSRLKG